MAPASSRNITCEPLEPRRLLCSYAPDAEHTEPCLYPGICDPNGGNNGSEPPGGPGDPTQSDPPPHNPNPNPNPNPQPEPPQPPPPPEHPSDPDPEPGWHVNLVVMDMGEETEVDPGGFMRVNSDFDESNKDSSGNFVPDAQPNHTTTINGGHRIVAGDAELRLATLYVSGPSEVEEGAWTITFPDKVKLWIWRAHPICKWVSIDSGHSETTALPAAQQFMVEGIAPSQSLRDVTITASLDGESSSTDGGAGDGDGGGAALPGGSGASDTAKLTLVDVDADVDSDNNNAADDPARTHKEDALEDKTGEPGKILSVNDGDVDGDGIPDFADGYSLVGGGPNAASLVGVTFVPYILDLRGLPDSELVRIRFLYSGSHPWHDSPTTPGGVVRTGSGTAQDPYVWTPGPGHLRLWTRNANERTTEGPLRNDGEYVAPDVHYVLSDFSDHAQLVDSSVPGVYRLWIEAVRPSEAVGDQLIKVEVDPDAWEPGGEFETVAMDVVGVTAQKMTIRWLPINTAAIVTHLDDNPHLNGGKRIFPDKDSPADTIAHDLIDVEVTITPAPAAGTVVHFQSYDVDDPNAFVPGQPPNQQIDPNDTATTAPGLDNRGTTPGKRGTFFPPTIDYRATAPTDAQGVARAVFQVTMQPGDNFRVAVALNGPELDTINDNTVPPNNNPNLPGFNGVVTEMLTVWRRLWIERDSMTSVTANTVNVTITGITRNVPVAGGLNDILQISADLPDDEDAFEGGELTITATGLKVPIYLNSDNFFAPHTLNVPAGAIPALAFPAAATVTDDDVIPATGTLKLPDGGPLLESAFGDAYILPKYVDPGPGSLNTVGTIPFVRHLNDTEPAAARNLPASSAGFWSTYLIGAFENLQSTDGDADGIAPPGLGIPAPGTDSAFDYGYSNATTSYVFLETIDDFVRQQNFSTDEWHTVTHEIGHTVGDSDSTHCETGIMRAGAPVSETIFDNYYLNRFRSVIFW